jgi:hypothetical protein
MKSTYYYIENGEQKGPVTLEELMGFMKHDTMIWRPGMSDWKPASEVEELASQLGSIQPPEVATAYNQGNNNYQSNANYNYNNTNNYNNANNYNNNNNGKPNNYLVWAILVTMLCCMPFGVVGLLKSLKVDRLWKEGDVAGAQRESESCKNFLIWGSIIGFIVDVLYFVLNIVSNLR